MKTSKTLALVAAVVGTVSVAQSAGAAPIFADVVAIVDESGSMSGEHAWLGTMIPALDNGLIAAGLTNNNFGLVGFGNGGGGNLGRQINVGGAQFGTAAQFATATGSLVTSGGFEDGYSGMNFANGYTYRAGAARNYILVTDEDRDNGNAALTYATTLSSLQATNTLLNAVVNATFTCQGVTASVLGISGGGIGYIAGANGTYTTATNCSAASGFGTTIADYVDLAIASGGAAWNLNILRGGGNNAVSFTNAFVDIKVQEIVTSVPEPSALMLVGSGLLALVASRRRSRA